ncbi:hypothetical protein [Photobacterium indicum]
MQTEQHQDTSTTPKKPFSRRDFFKWLVIAAIVNVFTIYTYQFVIAL